MSTRRLFYALLPDARTVSAFARNRPCFTGRLTPPERYHLTLVFLGNQPERRILSLSELVRLAPFEPFSLTFGKTECFKRAKTACFVAEHVPDELKTLRGFFERELVGGGFLDRAGLFKAHVTMARDASVIADAEPDTIVWPVRTLALVESLNAGVAGKPIVYRTLEKRTLR